jgi:GT2 family glycosyltransferase
MPSFDIILIVFNRLEYTQRTIASLVASGAYRDCERFIIVNNHSTDEGIDDFLLDMSKYKKTYVMTRPNNDGWGTAVNDALNLSRAKYVLLSNNDVEYLPGFHTRMFETFEHYPNVGILGVWRHTSHGQTRGGIDDAWFRDMDNVPAVGWMIPKVAMEKVGMLAEHGPCPTKGGNGEDTDYVMRMKNAGYLVGVPAQDLATHLDGY